MWFSIQQSVRLVLTLGLATSVAAFDLDPAGTLKDLVSKLNSNMKSTAMCAECIEAIGAAKMVAEMSDQAFVDTAKDICKFEKIQPDVVCDDLAEIEGPIFADVIKSISSDGPEAVLMCAALAGFCSYPSVPNYDVVFPKLKPANATAPPVSGRSKTLLHLSDIHVDPLYTAGTEADCSMPLCCRNYGNQTTPSNPASKWGDYSCDTPIELLDTLLDSIPSIEPEIDWAIITGDIAPQDVWLASQMTVTTTLTAVYSAISKHLAANNVTKVFPAVGNHDTAPVNMFPLKSQSNANDWVYETLASSWKQAAWLPDAAIAEVGDYGTYAVRPEPGLKIISLNTNLCYVDDFYIYGKIGELDPNGILAFLVAQLQASEDAGERVWIIGHVPPGVSDCFHSFAHYYYQIIQRYSPHVIAAQFFGHTHRDEFELFYDDESQMNADHAISVAYLAPSVVPKQNTNSAFRYVHLHWYMWLPNKIQVYPAHIRICPSPPSVYKVDPVTYSVLDTLTYHFDISSGSSIEAANELPTWNLTYSARAAYGTPSDNTNSALDASWWHEVTQRFETDDTLFQKYWLYRASASGLDGECNATCQTGLICGMRSGKSELDCTRTNPFDKRSSWEDEGVVPGLRRLKKRMTREETPVWARSQCSHYH